MKLGAFRGSETNSASGGEPEHKRIVVRVEINGKDAVKIVDCGATCSIVSKSFVKGHGLKKIAVNSSPRNLAGSRGPGYFGSLSSRARNTPFVQPKPMTFVW